MKNHSKPTVSASKETDLWKSVTRLDRLDQAWEKVRANGGCSGGDGMTLRAFQRSAAQRLSGLAIALEKGEYRASPLRMVDIPKSKGGVRRLLIPSVADRIIHTALAQALTPVLDPQFEESSFAYRPGRSVKMAVQAIEKWRKAGYWHVIEADIVRFFDAIQHDVLLEKLELALSGIPGADEIVDHVATWLAHLSQETGIQGKGVAQGSPLSPLLANLYLDALDETIHGQGVRLVRFADDFVVLAKKRASAEDALADVAEVLGAHGLELHEGGTRIVDFSKGFEFLGHLFVRSLILQQVSDPEEDLVSVFRDVALEDEAAAEVAKEIQAELLEEEKGGYDRGDRVLYVTEPGRSLGLRNLSFSVMNEEGREIAAIAHGRVDRLEIGPGVHIDSAVQSLAIGSETDLVFVNGAGETEAWLATPHRNYGALHMAQAAAVLDEQSCVQFARKFVEARIRNQRTQLFRLNRRQDNAEVTTALAHMGRHLRKLESSTSVASLRGIEGAVGALYWPALGLLCAHAQTPFRRSRPAEDALNASINYMTALLERDVRSALLAAGLHTGFGFLHKAQDRNEAAIYDMMEPFRAPLSEGVPVFLFNANRLTPKMYTKLESGVRISGSGRRALISGYESAVGRRVKAPGRGIKLAWRALMRRQALDLAGALRDGREFVAYRMEA